MPLLIEILGYGVIVFLVYIGVIKIVKMVEDYQQIKEKEKKNGTGNQQSS